jgi:hypothetical protein
MPSEAEDRIAEIKRKTDEKRAKLVRLRRLCCIISACAHRLDLGWSGAGGAETENRGHESSGWGGGQGAGHRDGEGQGFPCG